MHMFNSMYYDNVEAPKQPKNQVKSKQRYMHRECKSTTLVREKDETFNSDETRRK